MLVPGLGTVFKSLNNVEFVEPSNGAPFGCSFVKFGERKGAVLVLAAKSLTSRSRGDAAKELIGSPLTLPMYTVASVVGAILNTVTFGSWSVMTDRVENTLCGRLKGMGCSVLSVLLTPVTFLVSAVAKIAHVVSPKKTFLDALEAHLWTGFVAVHKPQED